MEALTAALRATLSDRHRDADPHQRARIGRALIAQETARLWVRRAALLGEATTGDPDDTANTVNLARLAVESACLDLIQITQRALGMAAFRRGSLTELLFRDLPMYLRQPAPDETLTEAAAHFTRRDLPALT
jgi:alkylation response protein AidB-like acyl-CoA dehydrogenase